MVLSLGLGRIAHAEEAEKARSGWAALPVASYSPETELGVGAFAARFFRFASESTATRPSSLAAVALVTTREQVITEFLPELYWGEERYRIWAKLDYRLFPNSVWGVGNNLPDGQRERYQEKGPRLQTQARRRIQEGMFLEVRLDAQHMDISRVEAGGLLDDTRLAGSAGGWAVGLGFSLIWDTRNHLLVPNSGGFYELTLMRFSSWLGSDYDYSQMVVNLRRYLALPHGHVLATQLYFEGSQGNTPFYRLALVGGQHILRGYFEGRFRDHYLAAAQVEYRLPLFWRLGATAFTAVGDVAPSIGGFASLRPKVSIGGGLRLLLNREERLNLRADVGFSPEGPAVYVGVAEAF